MPGTHLSQHHSNTLEKLRLLIDSLFADLEATGGSLKTKKQHFSIQLESVFLETAVQNQALHKAQQETHLSREHYFQLYDLMPFACFTFSDEGIIREANLGASKLINVARRHLREKKHPFTAHLEKKLYDTFFQHLKETLSDDTPKTCDLTILRVYDETNHTVRLHSRRIKQADGTWECVSYIIDNTPETAD